jgi:hypothetical protein
MKRFTLAFAPAAPTALAAPQTVFVGGMAPNWDQPYDYPDDYDASGPGQGNAANNQESQFGSAMTLGAPPSREACTASNGTPSPAWRGSATPSLSLDTR